MPRPGIWLKTFLLLFFVGISLTSVTIYWAYFNARNALEKQALSHLVSIRDIKKNQIEFYFQDRLGDTKVLANDPVFIRHLQKHSGIFPVDEVVNEAEKNNEKFFRYFYKTAGVTAKEMSLYDIFIIDLRGNVLHTLKKEDDFNTNLINGKYKDTGLAKAFAKGLTESAISDIGFYGPSQEKISGFFAVPVKDQGGHVLGVIASQITMAEIDEIMQERSGLGETGETYLVGSDLFLRSDSRFFEEKTVLKRKIDKEAPRRAIAGKKGTMWLYDYRNVPVLNAYTPLDIPGLNWGLIAKIDKEEVHAPIWRLQRQLWIGMLALSVLIILISYLIAKRLTAPLISLDKKLREMASSDKYGDTLPIQRKDEIGSLVASFNKMSSTIELKTRGLEEANKEMESFINSVSHDLQVPVISIQGMMTLLRKKLGDSIPEGAENYLMRIDDSALKMESLLHDLLDISLVGKIDVEPGLVNVMELAQEVVGEIKAGRHKRNIEFLVHPHIPPGKINKKRLYQVLLNLIGNAAKFMPETRKKPLIEIGGSAINSGLVEYYIRDNGKGIVPEYQEKIFLLFERLHGQDVPGTGMGLAFVKKIVENAGGTVRVESSPEMGTTFYFTLPGIEEG